MNIIEIKDLNRYFGEGENRVHILKNVSLNIEKGEFVAQWAYLLVLRGYQVQANQP